jgi:hypothetical protein
MKGRVSKLEYFDEILSTSVETYDRPFGSIPTKIGIFSPLLLLRDFPKTALKVAAIYNYSILNMIDFWYNREFSPSINRSFL